MHSKWIAGGLVGMLATGCGATLEEVTSDSNLPALTLFTEASGAGMPLGDNGAVFVDTRVDHLLRFKLDPFEFEEGIPLPQTDQGAQWILAAEGGRYFVTVKSDTYAIFNGDGLKEIEPIEFDNDIRAAALSSSSGHDYLFLQDDLDKIIILELSKSGKFKERYLGSATFGTEHAFVSGTMLRDGRFIASLGESTIGLVDLAETLEDQDWQVDAFTVAGATAMTWIAAVPEDDHQVFVKDSNRLLLLDIDSQTVLDEVDLSGKRDIRASRSGEPHVLAADNLNNSEEGSEPYQLYFVEDNAISTAVISSVRTGFTSSYLDDDHETLIVSVNDRVEDSEPEEDDEVDAVFEGDVYRFDVDKGIAIDKTEMGTSRMVVGDEFVIQHFDSALGLAKRTAYGDEKNSKSLKLFNLGLLREKYD